MAKDYMSIGCTPAAEDCVQVSQTEYYLDRMLDECRRYKEMLQAKFADCTKVTIKVKQFPHDFGTYAEVVAEYDSNDPIATAQAIHIENNAPQYWTETEPVTFVYEDDECDEVDDMANELNYLRQSYKNGDNLSADDLLMIGIIED